MDGGEDGRASRISLLRLRESLLLTIRACFTQPSAPRTQDDDDDTHS